MADEPQKRSFPEVVRLAEDAKKNLVEVSSKRTEREGRPVSEAELASKAVNQFCKKEKKKLGIS